MNIYIDEAGIFVKPTQNKCAISAVGALIMPEKKEKIIFSKFEEFEKIAGQKVESIKNHHLILAPLYPMVSLVYLAHP